MDVINEQTQVNQVEGFYFITDFTRWAQLHSQQWGVEWEEDIFIFKEYSERPGLQQKPPENYIETSWEQPSEK